MRTIMIRFADDVTNPTQVAQSLLSTLGPDCAARVAWAGAGLAHVEIPGIDEDAELEELWCQTCDEDDRVVSWQ